MSKQIPTITPRKSLFISGQEAKFPVRRVFCIGQNYAAHAVEMGSDPTKEPPCFFLKSEETIVAIPDSKEQLLIYPPKTEDYHHEVELVVALASGGKNIKEEDAIEHIFGFAIGLDMTRRDLQRDVKKKGHPWDISKSADNSAPIGVITPITGDKIPDGFIRLKVNGELRQDAKLASMIWNIPKQIAMLSTYFTLLPGDIIFTGTPEGVGAVTRDDKIEAEIEGLNPINLKVV